MTGTDDLRAALADTDTPAGVDVAAVRHRARRGRRRLAIGTVATVAALALALPVVLLMPGRTTGRSGGDAVAPGRSAPPLACPDTLPRRPSNAGPGLADALVPFAPEAALICSYAPVDVNDTPPGPLSGVDRLTRAEAATVLRRLDAAPVAGGQFCTLEAVRPVVLQVAGPDRAITLRVELDGCGLVGNGTLTRAAAADKVYLRNLAARAEDSSTCPVSAREPKAAFSAEPGPTLLPVDTRRLLLCGYDGNARRKAGWDTMLDPELSGSLVRQLNASRRLPEPCLAGSVRTVVIVAVAPDRVKRVLGTDGACGHLSDGVRQVSNDPIVRQLYELARRGR